MAAVETELLDMPRTWFAMGQAVAIGQWLGWVIPVAVVVAVRKDTEDQVGR